MLDILLYLCKFQLPISFNTMSDFINYVPKNSVKILKSWINELEIDIIITNARKTKLGDFRFKNGSSKITINNNLNKYSFLITLTHELAHAFIFKEFKNNVLPHGDKWKHKYRSMLLCFLSTDNFPEDILKELSRFMINPRASTYSDHKLTMVLKKYDKSCCKYILDVKEGNTFQLFNGRLFVKGKLLRKRYKCIELKTNKIYLFHPYAEVQKTQFKK